ncbi:hypothetical protein B296_00048097, partial [Ensete ventricosum]
ILFYAVMLHSTRSKSSGAEKSLSHEEQQQAKVIIVLNLLCQILIHFLIFVIQEDVAREAETGKLYRANYLDKYGRTVLVMRPGFQVRRSKHAVSKTFSAHSGSYW